MLLVPHFRGLPLVFLYAPLDMSADCSSGGGNCVCVCVCVYYVSSTRASGGSGGCSLVLGRLGGGDTVLSVYPIGGGRGLVSHESSVCAWALPCLRGELSWWLCLCL